VIEQKFNFFGYRFVLRPDENPPTVHIEKYRPRKGDYDLVKIVILDVKDVGELIAFTKAVQKAWRKFERRVEKWGLKVR